MRLLSDPNESVELPERTIDRSGDIDQRPLEERQGEVAGAMPVSTPPSDNIGYGLAMPGLSNASRQTSPYLPAGTAASAEQLPAMALKLQRTLDTAHTRSLSQLEALQNKIEVQEKRCKTPALDNDLQRLRFGRQRVLIANGPQLADRLREEQNRLADLTSFRQRNKLTREAHYPESQVLSLAVLLFVILVETGINGVLFADTSDRGLLGGWLEAIVLAIANAGTAFLWGRLVLPQINRRNFVLRAGAVLLASGGVALLLGINILGAHYRDFRAASAKAEIASATLPAPPLPALGKLIEVKKPAATGVRTTTTDLPRKLPEVQAIPAAPSPLSQRLEPPERAAIAKLTSDPMGIESFTSFFLLILGLCGATVAAADGYRFDDPSPGYGRRHRSYMAARTESKNALKRILNEANALVSSNFESIGLKVEAYGRDIIVLQALHRAYAGDLTSLRAGLDNVAKESEHEIASHYRLVHKVSQAGNGDYTLSTKPLPTLNDKHAKALESHERKLKALHKTIALEQSRFLDVFETASSDFQMLLSDASKASLRSMLPEPV